MTGLASEAAKLEDAVNLIAILALQITTGNRADAARATSALDIAVEALRQAHAELQIAITPDWKEIGAEYE